MTRGRGGSGAEVSEFLPLDRITTINISFPICSTKFYHLRGFITFVEIFRFRGPTLRISFTLHYPGTEGTLPTAVRIIYLPLSAL